MNPVALPAVAVAARRCALALSLAACVLQAAAPARADEGKGEHKAEAGKEGHKGEHKEEHEGKHEGEHKPSALHHVTDQPHWETFPTLPEPFNKIPLPPGITKFMILELIAALGIFLIYVPLARRLASGEPPRGAWDNLWESFLTFIRDRVARPAMGEHDADKYSPFLFTIFLFVLFNNLLGMVPFGGSATASIYVTLGLAICVFFAIHGSAIAKMGFVPYLQSLWPHLDLPWPIYVIIAPLVFVIEIIGVLVRNVVLAVRLFANIFAGHMVLATILIFVYMAAQGSVGLWATVTISSVLGMVAMSLLELFVAFLQAFIFTFLSALFMGMAMHPAH